MALALSVRQPWAWLIIRGYKPIENRSWDTRMRGEILIHAGRQFDYQGALFVAQNFPEIPLPPSMCLPKGGIVGKADLVGVINHSESKWFFGPLGFVLENAAPLPFRAVNGQLKFFEVSS